MWSGSLFNSPWFSIWTIFRKPKSLFYSLNASCMTIKHIELKPKSNEKFIKVTTNERQISQNDKKDASNWTKQEFNRLKCLPFKWVLSMCSWSVDFNVLVFNDILCEFLLIRKENKEMNKKITRLFATLYAHIGLNEEKNSTNSDKFISIHCRHNFK